MLYISHDLSVAVVWTSSELRGEHTRLDTLPQGFLTYSSGGVPTGYYDAASGQYWTYAHYSPNLRTPSVIRLARHASLNRQLSQSDFTTVISGESIGLGATYLVDSPSFTVNQP